MSKNLGVHVASGDSLDVRQFVVKERMSSLFEVKITALSENANVDFDAVVGHDASFSLHSAEGVRTWHGLCNDLHQVQAETAGLSTYQLSLVPTLWLTTQRRNHRMFQHLSELEIVQQLLHEWGIEPKLVLDAAAYKKRKYRVQYAESDHGFISRMLEDAGISYYFEEDGEATKLVLADGPQRNPPRDATIPHVDNPSAAPGREWLSKLDVGRRVRPGKYTVRDHDYRKAPSYPLLATAEGGLGIESKLERFHYNPGAFLFRADKGDDSPSADDKGKTRTDEKEGAAQVQRRLAAKRSSARRVSFDSNVFSLSPGTVARFGDHPRSDVTDSQGYLILATTIRGHSEQEWSLHAEAVSAAQPYHPPADTPKPKAEGVESATVVGPSGEEIHTDEFGRVRVHFHWDRESQMNENSSCWIHVSQAWGGAGYGGSNLPRVGQEVLVDFLGGDPDRPVITGRVYTNLQKTPYGLPGNKTQSGWKSNSTNRTGGYNEIMFEDASGKELVRMQAERDRQTLIKRDCSTTVGNDRAATVVKNDAETVKGSQTIEIGGGRQLTVHGKQIVLILEDHVQLTPATFVSSAKFHVFESSDTFLVKATKCIKLAVGDASYIEITPEGITIQGPKVHINPK
jgi:type VI secretion system secreted protein VgrG